MNDNLTARSMEVSREDAKTALNWDPELASPAPASQGVDDLSTHSADFHQRLHPNVRLHYKMVTFGNKCAEISRTLGNDDFSAAFPAFTSVVGSETMPRRRTANMLYI
jgi:hypothetical protein